MNLARGIIPNQAEIKFTFLRKIFHIFGADTCCTAKYCTGIRIFRVVLTGSWRSAPLDQQGRFLFVGVASSHDTIAARCRSHKEGNQLTWRLAAEKAFDWMEEVGAWELPAGFTDPWKGASCGGWVLLWKAQMEGRPGTRFGFRPGSPAMEFRDMADREKA